MGPRDIDGTETPEQLKKLFAEMDDVLTYKGSLDNINKERVREVLDVYSMLSEYFKGKNGVRVEYNLFTPSKDIGTVEVLGKRVPFDSSSEMLEAVNRADTFEIETKVNGMVCLSFAFYGLM